MFAVLLQGQPQSTWSCIDHGCTPRSICSTGGSWLRDDESDQPLEFRGSQLRMEVFQDRLFEKAEKAGTWTEGFWSVVLTCAVGTGVTQVAKVSHNATQILRKRHSATWQCVCPRAKGSPHPLRNALGPGSRIKKDLAHAM